MKPINSTMTGGELEKLNANSCSIISGGGERQVAGNLIVSGKYSGRLAVKGRITLDSNAIVTGEIIANELIIEGIFKGIARVENKAIFGRMAFFSGTITAAEADFHEGCIITGRRNVGITHDMDAVQDLPRNFSSINESIIFSGKDDQVFMVW